MRNAVKRNFILQQGFEEPAPAACPLQYSSLLFQPRIVFMWVVAGILFPVPAVSKLAELNQPRLHSEYTAGVLSALKRRSIVKQEMRCLLLLLVLATPALAQCRTPKGFD